MTPHDVPYFIDNGAFSVGFDRDEWLSLLDDVDEKMPHPPDFVVLPDVYNDAEKTVESHRIHAHDVLDRGFRPGFVLQPGLPVQTQVRLADGLGADTLFVGGECRWQRAHGAEIVKTAHDHGIRVHIGNPGSADGLVWAYRVGFDSVDTSSILQNQYWHWLERLESESGSSRGALKNETRQQSLVTDGGAANDRGTEE